MKLCITAQGNSLDTGVDPRFGRCQYLLFVDSETGAYTSVDNIHKDGSGAGIQVSQLVAEHKAEVVLTGNVGPNAFSALQAAQIKVVSGVSGKVHDVVEGYRKGKYTTSAEGPTVGSHFGTRS